MSYSRFFIASTSIVLALSITACSAKVAGPAQSVDSVTTSKAESESGPMTNQDWWPEQVDLSPLRQAQQSSPYGDDFDYAAEFEKLDLAAVKADIAVVLRDSKDWWPADYGSYAGLFIRLAWHSAGTYRAMDGRGGSDGGQIRFEPLNSWPDNTNLDKSRRLLWPVKEKYGSSLSWADLMILAGNVAMEEGGFKTAGFSGGRVDDWQADMTYWGPEGEWLASDRFHGTRELDSSLAAVQMGLIYVNPVGPDGNPDPLLAAHDIRETFARMGMNDVETVALIAGGHTFGKAHGAHNPENCVGVEPAAAGIEHQGFGWQNDCGTGVGVDATTSGLEGAWTMAPVTWTHQYLGNLYAFEWEQTTSPAGAIQWKPVGEGADALVPDAHDPTKRHAPMMLTTDLSMKEDPAYATISKRFLDNPEEFEAEFAKAWFKLTHRDLGPVNRYVGPEVPSEAFLWQDPVPAVDHSLIDAGDIETLKGEILATGLSVSELVRVAWASASTYRGTDMRGGANGARIRLEPQLSWAANDPKTLPQTLTRLEGIQAAFNSSASEGKKVSLADVIVLAGAAGVEEAARAAGSSAEVPFIAGRSDATAEQTDVVSFSFLEPKADGFRNYYVEGSSMRPSDALIDKAAMLGLNPREMTALVGGLRVLDVNSAGSQQGVLTKNPGTLSNDFFVNLLDHTTTWAPKGYAAFEGTGPDGAIRWTASEVDLVFGSNSELRAICEVYAVDEARFHKDFVAAWTKVMQADRFDLSR